jgi:hypothetical protein
LQNANLGGLTQEKALSFPRRWESINCHRTPWLFHLMDPRLRGDDDIMKKIAITTTLFIKILKNNILTVDKSLFLVKSVFIKIF